VSGIGKEET